VRGGGSGGRVKGGFDTSAGVVGRGEEQMRSGRMDDWPS
jgi:hypothetical protein